MAFEGILSGPQGNPNSISSDGVPPKLVDLGFHDDLWRIG